MGTTHFSTVIQRMKTVLAFLAFLAFASSERVTYDGYKVLRTQHLNMTTSKALQSLRLEDEFDFWQDPVIGRSADIMASPEMLPELQQILSENGIHYTIMIEDVEALHKSNEKPMTRRSGFDWDNYHTHSDINDFIDGLGASNSDWVATKSIGQTYEGRDMRVIEITKAGPGKPIAWIEAGIHAREWIASATATFMINELVNNYEQNKDIVDNLNIHFLPMANPDGYEYSRNSDRMWRKNRNPSPGKDSSKACKGVDLNRNWGFHWGEAGVSHNTCSDIYCGTGPFSELEALNIKNYVEALEPTPVLGHSIHSYSQLWLWPYGYAYNAYPPNKAEIKKLAEDAADALYQVHGTVFDPINSAELYPAAGASDDWYRGGLGTRYSFTTELRDTGYYGFVLPAEQIIPSGEELFAGMKVVFEKLIEDAGK